jgi:hypothetical protein
VERGPHERRAHDVSVTQRCPQLVGVEALDPRPQADERRLRVLRLHAGQPFDGVDRTPVLPFEQALPGQRRAVQVAEVQAATTPVR